MKNPSLTIFTATLNPDIPTFTRVLESVKSQKYFGKIEHFILDGGTTNSGLDLAKKYGCKILYFQDSKLEGANRIYRSLHEADGEIILFLESDNIIPHDTWFQKLVEPFADRQIFATYPAYNSYTSDMSLLTKYSALFGAPDPTLFYLDKSDKIPMYKKIYDKGKIIREHDHFWTVQFTKENLLTMGDNGFLIRKSVLDKFVFKNKPYIHVDAFAEMLDKGHNTYGVVKDSIMHTTHAHLSDLIKRRVAVKEKFYDTQRGNRTYLVYNPNLTRDRINLVKYIIFSLTFIEPFYQSVRGYLKIRDKSWFLHPLVCFFMVIGYSTSELRWRVHNDKLFH